jgi:hypothetical protein
MRTQDKRTLMNLLKLRRVDVVAQRELCDKELEHIEGMLKSLAVPEASAIHGPAPLTLASEAAEAAEVPRAPFPVDRIKGMTQKDAMVLIAKHYGGVIRTTDLRRCLQAAGLMIKTPHASTIVNRLINTSELFDHLSTGLYRLRESESTEPVGNAMLTASKMAMGGPVPTAASQKKSIQ